MSARQLIVVGTTFVLAACADNDPLGPAGTDLADQSAAVEAHASAAQQVETEGEFLAQVDFSTISFTPRGQNCLLTVDGQLVFSGTIEGVATGTTEALVFAPCEQAMSTPPGTYPDVFKSVLTFTGTVDGEPATANVLYMGGVEEGGAIDGRLVFANGVSGVLDANAVVAVGGTYRGKVIVH